MLTKARLCAASALIVCAGLAPGAARAALVGSTIHWQYYFGGGAYNSPGTTNGTFVVQKAGMLNGRFIDNSLTLFGIHSDRNSITFRYHPGTSSYWNKSVLSLKPTIHNGIALDLISPGAFVSVQIDPSTNLAGFDASRISYKAHQIQVDWQGLSFTPATIVRLDVKVRTKPGDTAVAAPAVTASHAKGPTYNVEGR